MMNERFLRWTGRISDLRIWSVIVGILALIVVCGGVIELSTAIKNPTSVPQEISIDQLVHEPVKGQYVMVSGYAIYEVGYEKTENGRTVDTYYFLVDPDTRSMVLVRHASSTTVGMIDGDVTITGMTVSTSSELRKAVKADMLSFEGEERLYTTELLYIADGATPPTLVGSATMLGVGLLVAVLCVVPFLVPGTVFAPCPLDVSAPSPEKPPAVKATGTFQKLKSLEPLVPDKGTRHFGEVVANLIRRGPQDLVIYIHQVVKTKTYGITTSTQESDWAAFFNGENVQSIEAGTIYGWKNKWGLRIQCGSSRDKTEHFFVIFESAGALAGIVTSLQEMGFRVTTKDDSELR